MLSVIVVGVLRRRSEQPLLPAIVSIASGGVTAFLMTNQWMRVRDASGLIAAQLTGWFWLSFLSVLAMVASGFGLLFSRARGPQV
jgi:hypothetical protein